MLARILMSSSSTILKERRRRRTNSVETRERERERNGEEATGTHGRVLQEEGRVEEAPDADESVPARHSWPRHRPRCLRRLPRWWAGLQKDPRSLSFSPPASIYFRCFSLRSVPIPLIPMSLISDIFLRSSTLCWFWHQPIWAYPFGWNGFPVLWLVLANWVSNPWNCLGVCSVKNWFLWNGSASILYFMLILTSNHLSLCILVKWVSCIMTGFGKMGPKSLKLLSFVLL